MDHEYRKLIDVIIDFEKHTNQNFLMLYSNEFGIAWNSGCDSKAEEFFCRTYPQLVKLIDSHEYKVQNNVLGCWAIM